MKQIITLLLSLSTVGCATIMNDATHSVQITSNVPDAKYVVKNKTGLIVQNGVTPSSVNLRVASGAYSSEKYLIDFTKEGHLPSTTIVDSELSGWYFGNLLFGGIIGLAIVDPISGKMWTLPDNANGNLTTSK
jgi:hypothetical protein